MRTIDEAVAAASWPAATAAKRGRDPRWPYVPVLRYPEHSAQILGVAFATREEAIVCAERHVARMRLDLAEKLEMPNHRALRAWHGVDEPQAVS